MKRAICIPNKKRHEMAETMTYADKHFTFSIEIYTTMLRVERTNPSPETPK